MNKQSKRTLAEIVEDYDNTKKMAEVDIETVPFKSRQGAMIGKRQASDRLVEIRDEYKKQILSNTVGFFLYGENEKVNKFADASHKDYGTVAIDALEMYKHLAKEIGPTMGARREWNVDQMSRLYSELRSLCLDLGYDDYSVAAPQMKAVVTLPTEKDLVEFLRDRIRESIGDSLNNRYLTARVWEKALENKYVLPVLVCTVSNATIEEEQALHAFTVKHNLSLDDESVIDPAFIAKMYDKYTKKNKKQTTKSE